jgi:16S rRNA (adenine1518-N6/adenine1519-N6)-dimethyltransferase
MTLTEMRTLLAAADLRLTRSLGQNFLHDGNQLRRIVALATLPPDAKVLEIGPGLGPLTEHLLDANAHVLAIEKDARLIPILEKRLGHRTGLELLHADALDWLTDPAGGAGRNWSEWHLVANLPYSVGSPILVELAHATHPPQTLVATLQSEVVDRIRARPRTSEFGVLSLLLGRVYQPGPAFRIPASCFFPPPRTSNPPACDSTAVPSRLRKPPTPPRTSGW